MELGPTDDLACRIRSLLRGESWGNAQQTTGYLQGRLHNWVVVKCFEVKKVNGGLRRVVIEG